MSRPPLLQCIAPSLLLALVTGCAGPVNYKEPPVATATVDSAQARIVMRSAGMPMSVSYAISTSPDACDNFTSAGRVFHSGREVLLPWIATMTEKSRKALLNDKPQVEQMVAAGQTVQVKGYSAWSGSAQQMTTSGACGPLTSQFTPAGGKTYLVEFRFTGTSECAQNVYEIGTAEQRLPVPVTPLLCRK